ncbi:uncharacterized protein LOC132803756 [Ziziphus jujuba]|uniref:Uncharacterized protein LOC132803756 n=1 Tax=Ziziphus jujuba TaxID=326968 RepID=A0ABM4A944_ZIZJJ|nr:uncharacterized protein LOC132803756 [Ziziphus jujuba]
MGDSQQKGKTAYNTWTSQQSNMLLELMVDVANRGWRDSNGVFSKLTVESKILPKLNEALGFHPNQKYLRTDIFADFEDLKIVVGNRTAIGKNSIGLEDDIDARIYGQDESTHVKIDDYVYDEINEIYDYIGAIDGTHIPATINGRDVSSYRNCHGKFSQNVLAACNFDLKFIYVLSGWEGSAHDSKLLHDVLSKYFLVDCGFPNHRQFLAPFLGVRYHLQDFSRSDRHSETAAELFNLRHSSLRNVIERIFSIFKSRFIIFKSTPPFPFKTQTELVLDCAGLHNFHRKEYRSDEFRVESNDESPSPLLTQEIEENNFEELFESQEQQRENDNEWRTTIASNM